MPCSACGSDAPRYALVGNGRIHRRVRLAPTCADRLAGLMGRRSAGKGLLLRPGGSVHTCFMKPPIDILFLNRDGRVLSVRAATPPWRIRLAPRATKQTLELPAGKAAAWGWEQGTLLKIEPEPPGSRPRLGTR